MVVTPTPTPLWALCLEPAVGQPVGAVGCCGGLAEPWCGLGGVPAARSWLQGSSSVFRLVFACLVGVCSPGDALLELICFSLCKETPCKSLRCRKRPQVLTLLARAVPWGQGQGVWAACPTSTAPALTQVPADAPPVAPTVLPSDLPSPNQPEKGQEMRPAPTAAALSHKAWWSWPWARWLSRAGFCSASPAAGRGGAEKPRRDPRLCSAIAAVALSLNKKPRGSGSHLHERGWG